MKELNLEVGQKVWSIQLGDCDVVSTNNSITYPVCCKDINGGEEYFTIDGKRRWDEYYPSLFESNPFEHHVTPNDVPERSVDTNETIEPKLVRQQNDGWVDSKAEMINALVNLINSDMSENLDTIAETKLQKLLESL